jgi:hypothetical protein
MAKVYGAISLTGGGSGALDFISGALLADGDLCFVNAAGLLKTYLLDADSALAENSPYVISPDTAPGDKRWILQNVTLLNDAGTVITKISTGALANSDAEVPTSKAALALVSDAAYGAGWAGVTDKAPSKNALYNELSTFLATGISAVNTNPKAMSQGVNMTYAASGSSGIAVADNDNIDFGTGNFTVVWKGSLPDWTPTSALQLVFKYNPGTGEGYYISVNANGTVRVNIVRIVAGNTTMTSSIATGIVDNAISELAFVVTRESIGSDGSVLFYKDGVQLGTSIAIPAVAIETISNVSALYILGLSNVSFAGTCQFAATFNRALTAAEVLDLFRNGIAFIDKWGSQTELMPNQVDRDFSGASAWANVDLNAYNETGDLSIIATVAGQYCTCPVLSIPTTIGYRYRLKFDVANIISTWTIKSFDGTQTIGTVSGNGLQQSFEWIATTTGGLRLVAVGSTSAGDFDNFTLTKLGATIALEPEGIGSAAWTDSSTNALNATYPATGSSRIRPAVTTTFATAAEELAGAEAAKATAPLTNMQLIKNLKPVVASAAVLDIFTKSGGAVPDASNIITVAIPDANGYTFRSRNGAVAAGTSIITLADAANYWSKGSLDAEIKTAWLYAIWSTADAGIVWALGGYSGFTIVPTTATVTDDDYFLLEGSSTYSKVATDFCIAVAKIRYQYDTADAPDHTIQATVLDAPQVIWNPKSDYGKILTLATTNTSASDITEYSAVYGVCKQSGKYLILGNANEYASSGTVNSMQAYIKVGSATYGSAVYKAKQYNWTPTGIILGTVVQTQCYVNAGDTIHLGLAVTSDSGNRNIQGDDAFVGLTSLLFVRTD